MLRMYIQYSNAVYLRATLCTVSCRPFVICAIKLCPKGLNGVIALVTLGRPDCNIAATVWHAHSASHV